jgi:uncharacterized protein DUF6390
MDGVALAARFSIATNRLAYCGPREAAPLLYDSIVGPAPAPGAAEALLAFEALAPYLELIGEKAGRSPLDEQVVEAYWIGNRLLEGFTRSDFDRLLAGFVRRGMPATIADRLRRHLPDGALPHHAFHVAFIGVGTVTGHAETTLATIESCRPSWAEVLSVEGDRLRLTGPPVVLQSGGIALGAPTTFDRAYDPAVLPNVGPGSRVALHWGWPALELTTGQADRLRDYTLRSFVLANRAWPQLRDLAPASGAPPERRGS